MTTPTFAAAALIVETDPVIASLRWVPLHLRTVPDPGRPQVIGARRDAVHQEASVGVGELAVRRSRDRDFDVPDGLLGRAVEDFPRHGARGILRAEWDDPEQTSGQRGNDMTDE